MTIILHYSQILMQENYSPFEETDAHRNLAFVCRLPLADFISLLVGDVRGWGSFGCSVRFSRFFFNFYIWIGQVFHHSNISEGCCLMQAQISIK